MSAATLAISSSTSPDEAPDTPIDPAEAPDAVVRGKPPLRLLMIPLDSSMPGTCNAPDGIGNNADDLAF